MNLKELAELSPAELQGLISRIGNTPMRLLTLTIRGISRQVYLKLEGENPAGSVKSRTAISLIENLERSQQLDKDSTIIESTSGNLGVALAFICKARGYRFIAVVDPKATQENVARMRSLGAQIDEVHEADSSGGYLLARLKRVEWLCRSDRNYVWTDQYSNTANPKIHFETTAPEIYRQLDDRVDAVFAAVSTGGTLAGIGRYFRKTSPQTRVIGVDAQGSVVFGGTPKPRMLTGIGSARSSQFISSDLYDEHILVSDREAFTLCRALAATCGIKVGGSSGAVLTGCIGYLEKNPEITRVACLCADAGENYTSTIFNDRWLADQGIILPDDSMKQIEHILVDARSRHA